MRIPIGAKILAALSAICLIIAHSVGALYDWEEDHWPAIAKFSFDLVDHSTPTDIAAHAVIDAFHGDDADRIAAGAVCDYLTSTQDPTTNYNLLVGDIDAKVPTHLNNLVVREEVKSLAGKIQGATQGGAQGHFYREACLGMP
jgi:hypothetical protein